MDQLARALANFQPRDKFRAPVFKGEGDVELYITQFEAVRTANGWDNAASCIHLRSSLEGSALDCGRETTKNGIYEALRARFGLTQRQAKDKLGVLKRSAKHTLHEHATEVGRLVELAFPTLARVDRQEMVLDYFTRSLDNRGLQRHMLAVDPDTLMEAVRAADEFLQLSGTDKTVRPTILAVETVDDSTKMEAALAAVTKQMEAQTELLGKLTARLGKLEGAPSGGEGVSRRNVACYICKGPHYRRNCPNREQQTQAAQPSAAQGNESGPAQH